MELHLTLNEEIHEVVIREREKGSYLSKIDPINAHIITGEGLERLPCCNLAESFENDASVDVSYADAVSGIKQIQMLGLAGVYTQIMRENIPLVRGLNANSGLTFVPGSWLESIQVSKGTSSVLNGFESTTGQINIEMKKPDTGDPLFINVFGNHLGRMEGNVTSAIKINDHISTMLLSHGSIMNSKWDLNGDSFLDMPLNSQFHFMNRWKFNKNDKIKSQVGIRYMEEKRLGGQYDFNKEIHRGTTNFYGIGMDTRQYEVFLKGGFKIPNTVSSGIGGQLSFSKHEQDSYFGLNEYTGEQASFYSNIIFNTIIFNTAHQLNSGISFYYDEYDEKLNSTNFNRQEYIPGIFSEYNYTLPEKLNVIAGLRADYHNIHGLFFTPRIHLKYHFDKTIVIRGSAGKGYRTANVLAENSGYLASSREWVFQEELNQEEAWNYGISLVKSFKINGKKNLETRLDFYRTDFVNQAVVDVDQDLDHVYIYNLEGESYSNSFLAEIMIEPVHGLDITAAYRFNDVKMTITNTLQKKPMVPASKGLLTLSYSTSNDKWNIDMTNLFTGSSRLPAINGNTFREETSSPGFYTLHVQVTKKFKQLELYAGGENLTNFKQQNPIIAPHDPFGNQFDSSIAWGPIMGRIFFAGLRYTLD